MLARKLLNPYQDSDENVEKVAMGKIVFEVILHSFCKLITITNIYMYAMYTSL